MLSTLFVAVVSTLATGCLFVAAMAALSVREANREIHDLRR